jgi:hypothetical protein
MSPPETAGVPIEWADVDFCGPNDSPTLRRLREEAGIPDPEEARRKRNEEIDRLIQEEAEERERERKRQDYIRRHAWKGDGS